MADFRREYGRLTLTKKNASHCPIEQLNAWFEDIIETDNYDPTAMVLSTTDKQNHPDSRVVLLKGIENGHFIFYTNYTSTKAEQLENNSAVALNFFWPFLSRQIRVKGFVSRVSDAVSDEYFLSRPRLSRFAAHASAQSSVIDSRQNLEDKMNRLLQEVGDKPIIRPNNWGGYAVTPHEFEFWQGRDNRLHDRLRYTLSDESQWALERLEP